MAKRWGNNGNGDRLHFRGLQNSLQIVIAAVKRNIPESVLMR